MKITSGYPLFDWDKHIVDAKSALAHVPAIYQGIGHLSTTWDACRNKKGVRAKEIERRMDHLERAGERAMSFIRLALPKSDGGMG